MRYVSNRPRHAERPIGVSRSVDEDVGHCTEDDADDRAEGA